MASNYIASRLLNKEYRNNGFDRIKNVNVMVDANRF